MDQQIENVIYVGGLAENVTEDILYKEFVTFGCIKRIEIPIDFATKKQRGFAFIEYEESQDAIDAIENYDGAELFSKIIKVQAAKPFKGRQIKAIWNEEEYQKKYFNQDNKQEQQKDE